MVQTNTFAWIESDCVLSFSFHTQMNNCLTRKKTSGTRIGGLAVGMGGGGGGEWMLSGNTH